MDPHATNADTDESDPPDAPAFDDSPEATHGLSRGTNDASDGSSPSSSRSRSDSRRSGAGSSAGEPDLQQWAILGLVLAAAIGALFTDCQPTLWEPADRFLTAAFAALVTAAASKARRWSWLVLAGAAGLGARGPVLLACAAVAVVAAFFAAVVSDERSRLLGAVIGAISVQVLLRLPELRYDGATALLTLVATVPVLVSGYRMCRRRTRKRIRRIAFVVGALVVVAGVGLGFAALEARSQMLNAVASARAGFDAVRGGHQQDAISKLELAQHEFGAAADTFSSPIAKPARAVPILGPQARTAEIMARTGTNLSGTAAVAAQSARYDDLKASGGQVNLALLASMVAPVQQTSDALAAAQSQLAEAGSVWLVPPLAGPLHDFQRQVDDALPQARLAADGVRFVPALLGANGPRRYFIAFGTPSETRYLGGFIGSYGELTAVNGKVSLVKSGSIQELSNRPGAEARQLTGLSQFLARYGKYQPARYLQNMSASPDFPTVAEVARQLYPQAGGTKIDGVIYVDPYGLAALLKLTGPVAVPGLNEPLTADNAADFLLRRQYIDFPDANERSDFLVHATAATFDALTTRQLPGPQKIGDALAGMAEQRRLMFTAFDQTDRTFLDELGVTGAFPAAPSANPNTDFFSLRTSNDGANKIDAYLQRSVDYNVRFDPSAGAVDVTATVKLRNNAPASGLPDYVIGNSRGGLPSLPKGTNVLDFSAYTALPMLSATLDGAPLSLQNETELGHHVYTGQVSIPAQSEVTVELHLRGVISSNAYRLDVVHQPITGADHDAVTVVAPPEWVVTAARGLTADGPKASGSSDLATDRHVEVDFRG